MDWYKSNILLSYSPPSPPQKNPQLKINFFILPLFPFFCLSCPSPCYWNFSHKKIFFFFFLFIFFFFFFFFFSSSLDFFFFPAASFCFFFFCFFFLFFSYLLLFPFIKCPLSSPVLFAPFFPSSFAS